jgi:tetratricopeptide (TPR) repeat protein
MGMRSGEPMKHSDRAGRAGNRADRAADEAMQEAIAAIQARQPDRAHRIAAEVIAKHPRHPGALHVLGLALLAQGRPREAVLPLEQAASLAPDPAIETHLGIALRQSGQTARALEALQRATARERPFPLAFHELGVLLFSLRRLDEAQSVLERGLALAPAMTELSVMLGGIYLDRGDRAAAKVAFARALTSAPGHPGALFGLGSALADEGEFAAAAERFRQALVRDPSYAQAQLSLANCLLELGRFDEAVASLRAAVKVAPHFYAKALRTLVTAGRGRFCLRPSAAAALLTPP